MPILISSWSDGVRVLDGDRLAHELDGRSVAWLSRDGEGRPLAIVDRRVVYRRDAPGRWSPVVEVDASLACCEASGPLLYLGTEDAQLLRFDGRSIEVLAGFQHVPGRERWYAGSAIVDGVRRGPPLGVRTIAVTCDGGAVLANVHVGGIPRSTDGGQSWEPTLDVDADAHDVHAHPRDPRCAISASAAGLCISRDAGHSWTVEARGAHAPYAAGAGFVGDDIVIACAADHFAERGKLYRRGIAGDGPLEPLGRGLPEWTDGIVDSRCIAADGASAAIASRGGQLFVSHDSGGSWSAHPDRFPATSGVLVTP